MYKTVVKVEGMACGMCEAHINDAVRKAFKVGKVTSSHKRGETVIISEQPLPLEELKSAITDTGYTVTAASSEPYQKRGLFGR